MRLIDADKLLEETRKDRDYAEKNGFLDMYYERQVLIDRIESQPTAYDVNKVIEELELHSFELGTDMIPVHYVRLDESIEIVKQGGVSDASDNVCEWKLEDEEANLYLTGCQQRQLIFEGSPKENGYTYCPYCGKKIKVVEQMDEEDFCYCHYHDDTYEYFDCLDYMECEECPYYYADEDQEVE